MSYLQVANSSGMWAVCSVIIFIVLFQAIVFMRKAWKAGLEMGLKKEQLKSAIRSGAISTIGPSLAVVVAMISLIVSLGAPFAWMRLSVVGSIPFELMAAESGALALGTNLGTADYNVTAFANSVWTCTLGASGWLLVCAFFTDKFDIVRKKVVGGNEALLPVLSVSAMIGAFAYFSSPYLGSKGTASTVACVVGAISMVSIDFIANWIKTPKLKEWALGIAMVIGMSMAMLFV